MADTNTFTQDQFIIYPYLGPATLTLTHYIVEDVSLPFHAFEYNVIQEAPIVISS